MGFSYGLVRGLTKSATGINEGKAKAAELEREALHQALADSLLKAQITKMNAPPPPRPRAAHYDQERGTVVYTSEEGPAQVEQVGPPRPKTEPRVPLVTGPGGIRVPDVPGVHVQEERRAPSQAEVAAQDQWPIVDESYKALEEIENRDPRIGNRVIAKANKARMLSVGKVATGLIGKLSGTRSEEDQKAQTEQAIINSLTPDEAKWYAASKGFLSGVLPALGGKNLTINEVITHGAPMFATGEESDESLAQKRRARAARYQSVRRRAGIKDDAPPPTGAPKPKPKYQRPK